MEKMEEKIEMPQEKDTKAVTKEKKKRTPKKPAKKPTKLRTFFTVGGILAGAVVIGLVAYAMVPKPENLPEVAVRTVSKGTITSYLDTSGTIQSNLTKTYFSPVSATVAKSDFQVGDIVKTGDMLLTYDLNTLQKEAQKAELTKNSTVLASTDTVNKDSDLQSQAQTANANINIINGNIAAIQSNIQGIKAEISQRTSDLMAGDDSSSVDVAALQEAQSAYADANQKLLEAQKAKEWLDSDKNTQTVSQEEYNKATDAVNQAQVEKDEAQSALTALTSGSGASTAAVTDPTSDSSISYLNDLLASEQESLADQKSQLAEQEAIVKNADSTAMSKEAKDQLTNSNNLAEIDSMSAEELLEKGKEGIKAEFNGIITKDELVSGSTVAQGGELFTVASNEDVSVKVNISKYDFDRVQVGQKAGIILNGSSYKGTVSSISHVAQPQEKGSPILSAEVKIDNPDNNIFLGVEAKVAINTGEANDALLVPVEAVNTGKDSSFCYVIKDDTIVKQNVVTGLTSSDYVQITGGLQLGDQVITSLPDTLKEGDRAKAAAADESAETTDGSAVSTAE